MDDASQPTQGDVDSPTRYGCHGCSLPSTQSTWETPLSKPPKGVGIPEPLSGTLKLNKHNRHRQEDTMPNRLRLSALFAATLALAAAPVSAAGLELAGD